MLTTVDATQMTILLRLYRIQRTLRCVQLTYYAAAMSALHKDYERQC